MLIFLNIYMLSTDKISWDDSLPSQLILECRCFQLQARCLVEPEHQVHVLYGLAHGSLQQVVDAGSDEQFVAVFLAVNQRLVGVHHLFQVERLFAVVGEGGIAIEVLVGLHNILDGCGCLDHCGAEDATGKRTAIGNEVDVGIEIALHLAQRLSDLCDMLVLEWLVDAQIVGTPREMTMAS